MNRSDIVSYLKPFFNDKRNVYHSLQHSIEVADRALLIGREEGLSEEDLKIVEVAGLFHDSGYATDIPRHEEVGAEIARKFLKKQGETAEVIDKVSRAILATKMTSIADDHIGRVIKDADVAHIGQVDYDEHSQLLRKEKADVLDEQYDDLSWNQLNQDFVKGYKWKTKGAKRLYNPQKKRHLADLKVRAKELKMLEESNVPTRGIETMYRVALRNHNQLSKIADNKANILLSITALMLSIIISALAPKIDTNPSLLVPTITIVLVCLVTMIFAILATRPKVSSAPYSREKLLNNEINLLFFGNFYKIPIKEFEWGMDQLMNDKDLLYSSLSKDLYFLGSVLARKYKYLQIAYMIFMIGLIVSTLAFVAVFCFMHV